MALVARYFYQDVGEYRRVRQPDDMTDAEFRDAIAGLEAVIAREVPNAEVPRIVIEEA